MNEQQRTIIAEGLRKICQRLAPNPTRQAAPAILRNSAQCKACGSHIESSHRRDLVACGCGSIAVDGGHDYIRRLGDPSLITDTSLFAPIG